MRFIGALSVVLVVVLAFGWSAPAHSQSSGVTLRSLGLCLDVDHGLTAQGTPVQLWNCHGGPNQRWVLDAGTIRSALAPNLCLDVNEASSAPGARVQIWPCHGGPNQRWTLEGGSIRSAIPGSMCLDVFQAVAANGTRVVSWNCNSQTNQQWSVQ